MVAAIRPWTSGTVRYTAHIVLRWVLGLTFVATSLGKFLDIPGFHDVMRTYDLFPGWTLWPIAIGMPIVEALIAISMLTGWYLRRGIQASLLFNGAFAVVLTVELLRGLHLKNCGCFGVFLARPLKWSSPVEDVVLELITLGVLLTLPVVRSPRRVEAGRPPER